MRFRFQKAGVAFAVGIAAVVMTAVADGVCPGAGAAAPAGSGSSVGTDCGLDLSHDIEVASKKLTEMQSRFGNAPQLDFRRSLVSKPMTAEQRRKDFSGIGLVIAEAYDNAAAEGRYLHKQGMRDSELIAARPDLVLQFAVIRLCATRDIAGLVKDGRFDDAQKYYDSANGAFLKLDMQPLSRPSVPGH